MMLQRVLMALAIAFSQTACRVAEPLVDVVDGGDDWIRLQCPLPPRCMPIVPGAAPQHAAEPLQIECAEYCMWETASGNSSEDCRVGFVEQLPRSAQCMEVNMRAAAAATELTVSDIEWHDVNITLTSEQPLTVVVRAGRLERVYIELQGPISLRFEKLEQFGDLRIFGRSSASGTPAVDIAADRGALLSINSLEEPFPGELKLSAAAVTDVDAHARALTFESTTLATASLHADTITMTDVTLTQSTVVAQHALWSAFIAQDSKLDFCGDARLITGQMARCALTACAGSSLRLYNSSFTAGLLDGTFVLSDANVEGSQLGALATTSISAYGSRLSSVQFCEHTAQGLTALGASSTIKCSGCEDSLLDNLPVCGIEDSVEKWQTNYCQAFADSEFPVCTDDIPVRANRTRG